MKEEKKIEVTVAYRAEIEVINFDEKTSWVRWYMPDFSDNGNIDLPEGNYEIEKRIDDTVTLTKIK